MNSYFSLKNFIKHYRWILFVLLLLSIIESCLAVAQFYFIGAAVNDLIQDKWTGVYILIGLFIGKLVVSSIKQIQILKTHKVIYNELITSTIGMPIEQGEKVETILPRSTIIHFMTDFFKGDLMKGLETIIRLILVLITLFILNKTIFCIASTLLIIVFLLYLIQRGRIIRLSKEFADGLVKEYDVLKERNLPSLYKYYQGMEKVDDRLMSISGISLSIIEILSFGFMITALIVLVKTEGENALGTFFTMLYYVMAFSETMFLLPSCYKKYLRIQEMSKKIG